MIERRNMAARVFLIPDIRDTLASLIISSDVLRHVDTHEARTYLAGWDAAIAAVAAAFGLNYQPANLPTCQPNGDHHA